MRIHQRQISNAYFTPILGLLDATTAEPAAPALGDQLIPTVTGAGNVSGFAFVADTLYRFDGITYVPRIVTEGFTIDSASDDGVYRFDGTTWVSTNGGATEIKEVLTIVSANAIPDLTYAPVDDADVTYAINTSLHHALTGTGISVSGKVSTYDQNVVGYNLNIGDLVVASYQTTEV